MGKKRRTHSDTFKAKVALEAVKGVRSVSEISSRYKVHSAVISQWKRRLVENAATVFGVHGGSSRREDELTAPLYEQIGRLQVELDWLRKKL